MATTSWVRPVLFPTARTVLRAITVGRWLTWAWMTSIVVYTDADSVRHHVWAWLGVGVALALTITSTWLVRTTPERLIQAPFVIAELALAVGLSVLNGYAFDPGHVFATTQSIATQWPLLAMATVGVAYGPYVAIVCGSLIGPAEWLGALANDFGPFERRHVVSLVATSLLYSACGGVFGWQAGLLRRVEGEISDRRARDEVGRVMHDTVLQTLALVERRVSASDPELAAAARQADRELRTFLFGAVAVGKATLEARVRAAVERVGRNHDTPVSVSVIDDGCRLDDGDQELLARAIGEAVANALEHAQAGRIVVFVETDEAGQVFASVRDDGVGFDVGIDHTGHGISESIVGRVESFGGRVAITSGPGGTEVCMWSSASS